MQDQIEQAKAELLRVNARLARLIEATPDDRLNWSPSATARTPIAQVAHCAMSVIGILMMLQEKPRLIGEFGKMTDAETPRPEVGMVPYPFATEAEIDVAFHTAEKAFTTREQVLGLLDKNTVEFVDWMEALAPEQFASTVNTFFGPVPIAFGITLPALHSNGHISQLEYMQTIYGDMHRHP